MKFPQIIIGAVMAICLSACSTFERLDGDRIFDDVIKSVVSASTSVLIGKIASFESTQQASGIEELHYFWTRGIYDPDEIQERFIVKTQVASNALNEYKSLLSRYNKQADRDSFFMVIEGVRTGLTK